MAYRDELQAEQLPKAPNWKAYKNETHKATEAAEPLPEPEPMIIAQSIEALKDIHKLCVSKP